MFEGNSLNPDITRGRVIERGGGEVEGWERTFAHPYAQYPTRHSILYDVRSDIRLGGKLNSKILLVDRCAGVVSCNENIDS